MLNVHELVTTYSTSLMHILQHYNQPFNLLDLPSLTRCLYVFKVYVSLLGEVDNGAQEIE